MIQSIRHKGLKRRYQDDDLLKRGNAMKRPPHPGGFVLRQCIEPLGLTITQAATALGVTRTTLSELVNEKRGISPETAARLSKVFGGSAATRLTQQAHYELSVSVPIVSSSSAWNSLRHDLPRWQDPDGHPARSPFMQLIARAWRRPSQIKTLA
jgi:addiction module HigA family antidote